MVVLFLALGDSNGHRWDIGCISILRSAGGNLLPLRRVAVDAALYGILDDTGQTDITAWHCTICGEVIDPVILKNRHSPPPNLLYGTKARKFSQRVTAEAIQMSGKHVSEGTESNENENSSMDVSNP